MDYNELFTLVAESPDEWFFTPLNASWWVVIPTELIKGDQPLTDYLPSSITPHLNKLTGDVNLNNLFTDIYTPDSEKHPINVDCVMLLNGSQDTYCLFGSSVSVYENGEITQFLTS